MRAATEIARFDADVQRARDAVQPLARQLVPSHEWPFVFFHLRKAGSDHGLSGQPRLLENDTATLKAEGFPDHGDAYILVEDADVSPELRACLCARRVSK